jgi:hypothetical protein
MKKPVVTTKSDGTVVVTMNAPLDGGWLKRLNLQDGDTLMLKVCMELDSKRLAKAIEKNLTKPPKDSSRYPQWLKTGATIVATEGLKETVKNAATWLPHAH